eukprot:1235394-Rhodomonas_salina.2
MALQWSYNGCLPEKINECAFSLTCPENIVHKELGSVNSAISLRASYAMSGTNIAQTPLSAYASYVMPGTNIR